MECKGSTRVVPSLNLGSAAMLSRSCDISFQPGRNTSTAPAGPP